MTDDKSCFCPNCEQAAARIEALVKENARLQTYNDSICEGSQTWVKTATSALNDLVAMKARAEAAEAERDALCRERDEAMIELNEKDARIVALATELCGANAELTAIRRGEG